MILIIFGFWYLLGMVGFIFWWTKDYNFGINDTPIMLLASSIGPFTWIVGYTIHGRDNTILIKKRI